MWQLELARVGPLDCEHELCEHRRARVARDVALVGPLCLRELCLRGELLLEETVRAGPVAVGEVVWVEGRVEAEEVEGARAGVAAEEGPGLHACGAPVLVLVLGCVGAVTASGTAVLCGETVVEELCARHLLGVLHLYVWSAGGLCRGRGGVHTRALRWGCRRQPDAYTLPECAGPRHLL